jgi:hypothetical protein
MTVPLEYLSAIAPQMASPVEVWREAQAVVAVVAVHATKGMLVLVAMGSEALMTTAADKSEIRARVLILNLI